MLVRSGSKLVRTKDGEFHLHVAVRRNVELKKEYAVGMGRRVCGTAPKFYGKRVSLKIFLRRKLGREKKLRAKR